MLAYMKFQAFKVPPEFPDTLRTLVREILRNQPQSALEINKFGKHLRIILLVTLTLICV
jgi:hypothetical protein